MVIMPMALRTALSAATAAALLGGGVLARFDFAGPPADRWELPHGLREISGLARDSAGDLFAHGDERAEIFRLDRVRHRVVSTFSFGEPSVHGDFEAIAVAGDRIFLVTSDGVLYAGPAGADGEHVKFVTYATGLGRLCEIEGMAYDPSNPSLLLACKEARSPQLRNRLVVYRWSLERRALYPKPAVYLGLAPIVRPLGERNFHPSDITIDPTTGHLLVVAARERAIAEVTADGEVVQVVRLRRRGHPQAEGIVIAEDGSLLIADEGGGRHGTLTTYVPAH